MPIDINLFRADKGGDPELIKESQRRRFASVELVDEIIEKDSQWRRMTGDIDHMKKERNAVQKEVGQKKKAKQECEEQVQYIKKIGEDILATEKAQVEIKAEIDAKVRLVGNIVDMGVKVSQDEDADNEVVSTWGTPRDPAGLLNHHDLLWRIGGYEPERGVAVAGHRGYFLKDMGVMLNQAFINYGIAFLRKKEYSILQPPYMMKKSVMSGVAQLEQFDEELYKVSSGTSEDNYLIATSEQPICGFHMGEWIEEKSLPLKYSGVSTCFRKEAGSHGKDTWGIFRVHQFEKVEQFVIVEGDLETSKKMQEQMSAVAEEFYQSLGFPYQVISIVTGALNNAAIKKLDLECWFPGYNAYRELVSCSNCTDYQSRSMEIRCGQKKLGDREKKYVHMLNSTLCATGRAICCLLETYQTPDGVRIPDVLVPFMGGITFMPFVRGARGGEGSQYDTATKKPTKGPSQPAPKAAKSEKAAPKKEEVKKAAPKTETGPGADVAAAIVAAGDKVRDLKAAKADKAEIKAKVDELLALKAKYQEVTGKAYAPGSAPAPKAAPKKEEVKKAPVVPAAAPKKARPTPPSSVWAAGKVDPALLEARLKVFSYVGGYAPSAEDCKVLDALGGEGFQSSGVSTSRWLRNVKSFTAGQRATW